MGPGTSAPSARESARHPTTAHKPARTYTRTMLSPLSPLPAPSASSTTARSSACCCAASPGRPPASSRCTSPPSGRWSAIAALHGLLGWAAGFLASLGATLLAPGCSCRSPRLSACSTSTASPPRWNAATTRRCRRPAPPRCAAGPGTASASGLRVLLLNLLALLLALILPDRLVARLAGRGLRHRSRPVHGGRDAAHAAQRREPVPIDTATGIILRLRRH